MPRLEQSIHQRCLDGVWELWQKLPVTWGKGFEHSHGVSEGYEVFEWLPVASFPTELEAIRFWNACFLASNALAPSTAGDGSGQSLSQFWIDALNLESDIA